jgi:Tfp pilus assembly protein PilO
MNSDEALVILFMCLVASPLFTCFGVIVLINQLGENLKEQEKEEKKLAEAAKKKAAKASQ